MAALSADPLLFSSTDLRMMSLHSVYLPKRYRHHAYYCSPLNIYFLSLFPTKDLKALSDLASFPVWKCKKFRRMRHSASYWFTVRIDRYSSSASR